MEMGVKSDSQVNLSGGSSQSGGMVFKLFAIIAFICTIVALVAIILAAVAMSKNGPSAGPTSTGTGSQTSDGSASAGQTAAQPGGGAPAGQRRVWLITHGHDWGSYEYIDDKGYIQGFAFDVVAAACDAAGMDCRSVWDPYTNCWQSKAGEHPRAGPGIMGKWYDACTGWVPTVERIHVLRFSKPFVAIHNAFYYFKPGVTFDATNLVGKKIGFLDGWVQDEKCLARNTKINNVGVKGIPLPVDQIAHYSVPTQLKAALIAGDVHAAFAMDDIFQLEFKDGILQREASGTNCALGGNSMMTRKDNTFNDYFNQGLDKIRSNGVYAKLCENAADVHLRGDVMCV